MMLRRLALATVLALLPSLACAQFATIAPTPPTSDNGDRIATTAWVNNLVNAGLPLAAGQIWIGSAGGIATPQTPSGDLTMSNAGVFTLATVNANVGSFGSATQCATVTVNAKGLITAASAATCTPAVGSITGFAAGIATFLATPSSANLAAAVTNETGSGALVFGTSPAITTPTGIVKGDVGLGNVANVDTTNAANITSGSLPPARLSLSQITNSLGANVLLNNTANYFDGPSVAQGVTGTWFASGVVTLQDPSSAGSTMDCKLWDGTTVIASGRQAAFNAAADVTIGLSGFLASPAGNLRISCKDASTTTGLIIFNATGSSKDSTISAFRIQ